MQLHKLAFRDYNGKLRIANSGMDLEDTLELVKDQGDLARDIWEALNINVQNPIMVLIYKGKE